MSSNSIGRLLSSVDAPGTLPGDRNAYRRERTAADAGRSGRQAHRKRLQLVEERRLDDRRRARELHRRIALERLLQEDVELEPGERGPEAEMAAAGPERLVLRIPADVEAIGILVTGRVAIRRDIPHDDLLPL